MSVETVADLAAMLANGRLLKPGQFEEFAAQVQPHFPEPRSLAAELIRREWLTPFQVNKLFQGHGDELLLGSYVLLERLGVGGMGEVFKARNWKLDKIVAIKLIRPDRLGDADTLHRFQREVRAAAQLNHANVVHAFDCDEADGKHFLVLEYVEGIDLARLVKQQGPLPVAQACDCVRQAALGLQHAFERGLVHRDIKPHNMLLTRSSGAPSSEAVLKILDMGLARLSSGSGAESDSSSTVTEVGTVMGTVDYMAPEQALNAHAADIRADLYSLGCTFYFLLTGRIPFPGGSATEKLIKHQSQHPLPVHRLRPETPAVVSAIVAKLMAKRPEQRFQSPAEVAAILSNLDSLPTATAPPLVVSAFAEAMTDTSAGWSSLESAQPHADIVSPSEQRRARQRSHRQRVVIAVVVGLMALLGLLAFLWRGGEPTAPQTPPVGDKEPRQPKAPLTFDEWKTHVGELPVDRQLKEVITKLKNRNPDFEGDVKSTLRDSVVIGLEFSAAKVSDLRSLQALPRLQALACYGAKNNKAALADLSPLKGMKLTSLNCNFTRVTDLTPLRGMPLKVLYCGYTSVTDLTPLHGMNLSHLNIIGNKGISDLSPLRGMSLTLLLCRGTSITDLSPLRDMPLINLSCPDAATSDHATLRSLRHLQQFNQRPIAEFWKTVGETKVHPPIR